jgi:predicted SprT family Zn-dependent metalloprotease
VYGKSTRIVYYKPITIYINISNSKRVYRKLGIAISLFHELGHYILFKFFGRHKIQEIYDDKWVFFMMFKDGNNPFIYKKHVLVI